MISNIKNFSYVSFHNFQKIFLKPLAQKINFELFTDCVNGMNVVTQ